MLSGTYWPEQTLESESGLYHERTIDHPLGIAQPHRSAVRAGGRQRVRFALEGHSDAGISDVTILEARSGTVFRHFKPGRRQGLFLHDRRNPQDPVLPDSRDYRHNGRTAIGPTVETFQDGNRVSAYMDNIDSGAQVIGWDENHKMLKQWSGWIASPFHKGSYPHGRHAFEPFCRRTDLPRRGWQQHRVRALRDRSAGRHGRRHRTEDRPPFTSRTGWPPLTMSSASTGKAAVPGRSAKETSGLQLDQPLDDPAADAVRGHQHPHRGRAGAVPCSDLRKHQRGRRGVQKGLLAHAHQSCPHVQRVQTGPMYVAGKDQDGEWSGVDDGAKDSFIHDGVLGTGDYIFMGSDYAGAPAVINVGDTPLSYSYAGQGLQVFVDGNGTRGLKQATRSRRGS